MNILFCYDRAFCRENGGISSVSLTLMEGLERRGHRCFCLSVFPCEGGEAERQFYLPHASTDADDAENREWFRRFLADNQINIIINQNGTTPRSYWPVAWAEGLPVRKLTVYHSGFFSLYSCDAGSALVCKLRLKPLLDGIWRRFFRLKYGKCYRRHIQFSDRVVMLTDKYFPELAWFTGVPADRRFAAVYNAVDERYSGDAAGVEKQNEVLFVGRLCVEKRVDYLLRIWSLVAGDHPDWHLTIVGDGDRRSSLERQMEKEGIPRVVFTGYQDPLPYYCRARINCLTSSKEGFSLALVEAMRYRCVPMAFDSYACASDIIDDGQCGWLIQPFDTGVYARKLAELMDDQTLLTRFGEAARDKSEVFSLETILDRWEDLFHSVANPGISC